MRPDEIKALIAVTPKNLRRLAREIELPLPIARSIKIQATNLILGRCVLCGEPTLTGMCRRCKSFASDHRLLPMSGVKLLKSLRPADQLLRGVCESCGNRFMLSAWYLLRKLKLDPKGEPRKTCRACWEKSQQPAPKTPEPEVAAPEPIATVPEPEIEEPLVEEPVQEGVVVQQEPFNCPFRDAKLQRLRNNLPKGRKMAKIPKN